MRLPAVPGSQAVLRVNGAALREYHDEDDGRVTDSTAVKYVETVPGSNYSVYFSAEPRGPAAARHEKDAIRCQVYMDGKTASRTISAIKPSIHRAGYPVSYDCAGVDKSKDGKTTLAKFKFASINTSDESTANIQSSTYKNLGEVEVQLLLVRTISEPEFKPQDLGFANDAAGSIPEKCLKGKALSQRTALDTPELLANPRATQQASYPYGEKPFATFIFKYRSRRDLQIEGIIPRDSSPTPVDDDEYNELSVEEAREELRRRDREREEQLKIKKEKRDHASMDDEDETDGIEVTREGRAPKRLRPSPDSGVEIIDISDDE